MSDIRTLLSLAMVVTGVVSSAACAAPGSGGDEAVAGDPQALTECDATGTWAMKITTPVTWPATFVLQAGTGSITNWLQNKRVQTGTQISETARVCGVETADYQAPPTFGSEKYGIRFTPAVFEALPKAIAFLL